MITQRFTTLKEIKTKYDYLEPLPYFFKKNYDSEESVVIYEGDLKLKELNLTVIDEESPFVIIIEGSLSVEDLIWNEETDYGTNLLVLGNLTAQNIATGGQTISVWGNLEVKEILCGSYNHGDMFVNGDIRAKVIVADDYTFSCASGFYGIKIGHNFYDVKSQTWLEPDYEDWDMVFENSVLDEDGFSFDKLIECLKNKTNVSNIQSNKPEVYDFKSLLEQIISSKLVPKPYPLLLPNLVINHNVLMVYYEDEVSFKYILQGEQVVVERIEDDILTNIKTLPFYMTKKAFRFLKIAHSNLANYEIIVKNRLQSLSLLRIIFKNLIGSTQIESLEKRIQLSIQNPVLYCETYVEDYKGRVNKPDSHQLHISTFIHAAIEQGIAISLDENQSLQDGLKAIMQLLKVPPDYHPDKFEHIKWGRKLFRFSSDLLVIIQTIPHNISGLVRCFKNYATNEITYILVDNNSLIDNHLRQFYKGFEIPE